MLELRRAAPGLLDEPLALDVRGAPPGEALVWRARHRDDDGRVWRATAARAEDLALAWAPAKAGSAPIAALQSLRPVEIDVRVEAPDGRAAARTLTRRLLAEGVRQRRWRDGGVAATLHRPAAAQPSATLVIDATAGDAAAAAAALAAPLLASRGALVLAVTAGLREARERLAAVPGAGDALVLPAVGPGAEAASAPAPGDAVVLPPGVGVRDDDAASAAARAAAWDALIAALGAHPRGAGLPPAVASD